MSEIELSDLANELYKAKSAEKNAKDRRIEVEEKIAEQVETGPNSSKTVDAGDGVKLTVKRGLSYKADVDAIRSLDIPEEVMPVKLTDPKPAEYVFDLKAYENIIENHPDIAKDLAQFVKSKPKKVSVSMKL